MKYTDLLKISLGADLLFLLTLIITAVLYVLGLIGEDSILSIILPGATLLLVVEWVVGYGKYKKWRNVWKDPIWQKVFLIIVGVVFFITTVTDLDYEKTCLAVFIPVTITQILRDVRYYNRATKYDMDNLSDVNELARKFPEARPYINRKEKRANKEGDKVS